MLDERYEILDTIYESDSSCVYLARHRGLSDDRIIKRIKKASIQLSEAEVLKSLSHPGVPILYDYDEDEVYIYLVEEYIEGITLYDYLEWKETISLEQICSFLVQICDIISYLHEREPFPILYQDLKPEHLFLRQGQLILIDYGSALYVPRSGTTFQKYGTIGYTAPELLCRHTTDIKTDIYSIGCIAKLLLEHSGERIPGFIRRLAYKACEKSPEKRPDSSREYGKEWQKALRRIKGKKTLLPFETIGVAGISDSCGTTHIAISLVVYLNTIGMRAYYEETQGDAALFMSRDCPGISEKDSMLYHHRFLAKMNRKGENEEELSEMVAVTDCGRDIDAANGCDIVIIAVSSRPWLDRSIDTDSLRRDAVIMVNPANRFAGKQFAKTTGRFVCGFPKDEDPFFLSKEKRRLFNSVLRRQDI